MKKQEMFNKVWNHFIVEGNPLSWTTKEQGHVFCMYRGPNGTKCAVGVLIPDEEYDEEMEGMGIYGLVSRSKLPLSLQNLSESSFSLLALLQTAHDNYAKGWISFDSFKERLEIVAQNFGLTVPE